MKKLITSSSILWSCLIAMVMMLGAQNAWAEYVPLTALDGWNAWSGGGEGYTSLVDANKETKWGTWFQPESEAYEDERIAYIIVKAEKAVKPEWYFLVTGNDTGGDPNRNWKSWKIFGGNFESDELAVRDVENYAGWTLLDNKEDEPLPAQNFGVANLQFDYTGTETFQYFWIEILDAVGYSGDDYDVYLQMSEWGLGSYGDFEAYLKWLEDKGTGTDEPLNYFFKDGAPAGFGGEGLSNLFDGSSSTKWCCSFTNREKGETANGGYVIFKASRNIAPTYYSLTTANDTQSNPGRNWKQWQLYGMNAIDDASVTRDAEGWVLLDDKTSVPAGTGLNQLPAANYTQALFTLSEENTTEYRYFKVELDQVVTSGLQQMSELALGDVYTVILDRSAIAEAATADFNPDLFAEKALLDQMESLISQLNACEDPVELGQLSSAIDELKVKINASASNYAELITARNQAVIAINGGTLSDEAVAYLTAWISETDVIAPCEDYPVGNLAYIKANRQLTGAEALAEANRINAFNITNSELPEAITAKYKFISGTTDNWNAGEGPEYLIDGQSGLYGTESTKWGTGTSQDRFVIFKSVSADDENVNEPIQPTYYGLVTGGDTDTYKDRNWKNWKIWAANFENDEEATKDAEGWVLIDVKQNVGTDILKTTNCFESYIYLSEGCAVPYTYFKIEVYHTGGMQMNEFTFYNSGNLYEYRDGVAEELGEDFDPSERLAYEGYVNTYKEKFEELKTTVNAPDVMKLKNELVDMQADINASADMYEEYEIQVEDIESLDMPSANLQAWQNGYLNDNVAPNNVYMRGTHNNIVNEETNTGSLDNTELAAEMDYLQWIYNAVDETNDCHYILLGGHTDSQWGDGYYGHLIDGIATAYVDEEGKEQKGTKWGGNASATGDTYIIFRTLDKTNPFFYTLTTGNDTAGHTGRNWGTWYIYGANFEGDGDATKDAEGWVLIDSKENMGQDRLHPVNEQPSYFGFSTETTEEYMYYKVVVTKAYSGVQIQMNELIFGTEEEFDAIKDEYTAAAQAFEHDVVADQALIDEYVATIPEIEECMNMEALFRVNYTLEELRAAIETSAALYQKYQEAVDANKTFIGENPLADSEALTIFANYLNFDASVEPSELYPNGPAAYILDEHVLNDSILLAEMEFMESLKAAAVAAGYLPGADITSLIVNRTFAKASETKKDENGANIGREAEGWDGYIYRTANAGGDMYAAEFCNENKTFDISQTLTDMKNGFYKVTLNAGFRANGNLSSCNYAAMAYANDATTYVPVLREGMATEEERWTGTYADKEIYAIDINEPAGDPAVDSLVVGYVIWGCEGAAHAFEQGRYAITLVAQVTDGTLTFGVKNEGTSGNEWTAVGNFGLVYLGETEDVAAEALAEVAEYNAARIVTLTETYQPSTDDEAQYVLEPGFSAAQKATLAENSGVATYAAEKTIGETMQSIYETKKAYAALFEATTKVYLKWFEYASVDGSDDAVYEVRDNLQEGTYADAEAAVAAKDELYAAWPEYLEVKGQGKLSYVQDGFTLDIATEGTKPYIDLANLYEPLTADKVILAFDYKAAQALENGKVYYNTPNLMTEPIESLDAVPATEEWTTVYVNVAKAVKTLNFGSAVNHGIRWYVNYAATADDVLELGARNFHFITKAEMKAAGGKSLNAEPGDVNRDGEITIADGVAVLNAMAGEDVPGDADVNGDGDITIADFVAVLNLMAEQ
ncbi:MAG: dockerin type I repeat-containing protein [Bacteroidaceae bacterium]|nr:dockerin type I repeat-containing protein [Bacteroidaceae bacterium]